MDTHSRHELAKRECKQSRALTTAPGGRGTVPCHVITLEEWKVQLFFYLRLPQRLVQSDCRSHAHTHTHRRGKRAGKLIKLNGKRMKLRQKRGTTAAGLGGGGVTMHDNTNCRKMSSGEQRVGRSVGVNEVTREMEPQFSRWLFSV